MVLTKFFGTELIGCRTCLVPAHDFLSQELNFITEGNIKTEKTLLSKFKNYVRYNYNNYDLDNHTICSDLNCSKTYLNELVSRDCGCSTMEYVGYFRILKAMELMSNGERKVCFKVGYKSASVFCRAFFRVTGFHSSCFYAPELEDYRYILPVVSTIAEDCPMKAINSVVNNSLVRPILLEYQQKIEPAKFLAESTLGVHC